MKLLTTILSLFMTISAAFAHHQQPGDSVRQKPFQTGKATYYGNKWHGRRTASGVLHDKDAMMCAHRTLKFGTMIRVVNKKNGKWVDVKVTDRGPFGKGMIVDLSTAAARAINMLSDGVVMVDVYVLPLEVENEVEVKEAKTPDPAYLHLFDKDSTEHK